MSNYDRLYDMPRYHAARGRYRRALKSLRGTRCEGGDSNPQALRRQILSLVPSPQSSSVAGTTRHQAPPTATHRPSSYDRKYDTAPALGWSGQ